MARLGTAVGGLLEREESLAALTRAVESAQAGSGTVITVIGPPGIGKSALLEAAGDIATELGFWVTTARGGELEKDFPFGLTRQLFGSAGVKPGGHASEAARVFDPSGRESHEEHSSHAVLRALYWMVAELSDRSPVAIIIDDAQWSDLATLRFVDYLSRRLDDLRVLVVLAARDTEPGSHEQLRALLSVAGVEPIRPQLLSKQATEQLLAERLESKPDGLFSEAAHELTGGNPFLLGELADELARFEIEPDSANVDRLRQVMPPSVEAGVAARIERLGSSPATVAAAVAVLGDHVQSRLVSELMAVGIDEVSTAADSVIKAGIFSNSRVLAFRHPLLRSAVLSTIPRTERSRLHSDAARCLMREGAEPSRVAAQLLHVEPRGEPETARILRLGASESLVRGSPESAVAFLRRALEELGGRDPERPSLLFELGCALAALDPVSGAEVLADAARSAGDADLRTRAAVAASHALATAGRVRQASRIADSYLLDADGGSEPSIRALARMAGEMKWTIGESFDDAMKAARRYWSLSEGVADEAAVVAGGKAYIECVTVGDVELARSLALAAAADDSLVGLLRPGDYGAMATVVALIATDELTAARALCARLKDAAVRSGEPTALANCAMWSAWAHTAYGDLMSAEVDAATSLDITRRTSQYLGVPSATMASVLVERGDTPKAAALLDEVSTDLDGPLDDRQKTMALITRSGLRLAAGRFYEAVRDLDRVAASNPPGGDRNPLLGWRALRAMALLAVGRTDEATDEIARYVEQARRWGAARSLCSALRIAARVETDPSARLDLLREASEAGEATESRLERAKVGIALGSELRRQGRRVEARTRLEHGYELATACGAAGLAEFALSELVAGGAQPRRARSTGKDALTASERRVAEMAADGLTNREIAEALFVSTKTVTFHLTNCYRKLGVTNRADLAQFVDGF